MYLTWTSCEEQSQTGPVLFRRQHSFYTSCLKYEWNKEWGQISPSMNDQKGYIVNTSWTFGTKWMLYLSSKCMQCTNPVNNLFIFFIESRNRKWLVHNHVRTFTSIQSTNTANSCFKNSLSVNYKRVFDGIILWTVRFENKLKTQLASRALQT